MATKKIGRRHTAYHNDGTIWAKGRMSGDKMAGYWEWFRKDGSKMRSGYFENGEQAGEWTTYDRDGTVVKVTMMKPKVKSIASGKSTRKSQPRARRR